MLLLKKFRWNFTEIYETLFMIESEKCWKNVRQLSRNLKKYVKHSTNFDIDNLKKLSKNDQIISEIFGNILKA